MSFDAAKYTVQGIYLSPPIEYPAGAEAARRSFQECGDGTFCIGQPTTVDACGTWLGMENMCCYVAVYTTESGGPRSQPCDNIPEMKGKTFENIGPEPSECNDQSGLEILSTTSSGSVCCPDKIKTTITYEHPDPEVFGVSNGEPRCSNFTISKIVPDIEFVPSTGDDTDEEPFSTLVASPSPSPSSNLSGGSSTGSDEDTSESSSSESDSPTSTSEVTGQPTPNSASSVKGSSKLGTFFVASIMLTMLVGAQL